MTREEAKDYIREWCPYDRQEEIIKALEQEPCEDCISREQAIRIAEQGQLLGYEWQFKELCKLPSIQPKTDVLDKIRAEIKEVQTYKMFEGEDTVYVERKDVLAIIDKCKSEKE